MTHWSWTMLAPLRILISPVFATIEVLALVFAPTPSRSGPAIPPRCLGLASGEVGTQLGRSQASNAFLSPSGPPMVMRSRTPWRLKLRPEQKPCVIDDPRGRMLIPTPLLVARALKRVPPGRLITPVQLRARLARTAGADFTCPMTTGIFLNIVAGATEEAVEEGKPPVAPYWRVVDDRGNLPPKFPPGRPLQAKRLRAEGHHVSREYRVADVDAVLVRR